MTARALARWRVRVIRWELALIRAAIRRHGETGRAGDNDALLCLAHRPPQRWPCRYIEARSRRHVALVRELGDARRQLATLTPPVPR